MIENGIKLLPEVDSFEMAAGTLLGGLRARNIPEVKNLSRQYNTAISALCDFLLRQIKQRAPDPMPNWIEQNRYNISINVLRKKRLKFCAISRHSINKRLGWEHKISE